LNQQPNIDDLLPDKTYFFFSHVIKGQPENMALLQVSHCKCLKTVKSCIGCL
jgi:hypothetical protein